MPVDDGGVASGKWAVASEGIGAELATDHLPLATASIARSGLTIRHTEWRDELSRCGVRGRQGQRIEFARLEPLPGLRFLHAVGETRPQPGSKETKRAIVSFGPEHAPLEQRQVEQAWDEARTLSPK